MQHEPGKLLCADPKINTGIHKVDNDVKNKNDSDELPYRYGEHGIKNTEPVPKWSPFFWKIECSVAIYKTSAVYNAGIAKTGVLVDF